MPRELRIIIDDREKQPLAFPSTLTALDRNNPSRTSLYKIVTTRERLEYGDYLCPDARHAVVIERKKNLRELCGNCLNPRKRANFVRELKNLRDRSCFPWLLIEGGIDQLEDGPGDAPKNLRARDVFIDLLHEFRVSFMCARSNTQKQRLACGRWVAATILSGIHYGDHLCCEEIPRQSS